MPPPPPPLPPLPPLPPPPPPLLLLQTWYALHGHLVGYNWTTGYVLADEIKNLTLFMKQKGFVDAGYDYINLVRTPAVLPELRLHFAGLTVSRI